jgi:hypothetical protein
MSQFIEAVLFAEFDIDKGSILRHQYPEKVSDDEGLLAELMLPEGTHNHFQDWTIFMLNRPSSEPVQASKTPASKRWPAHAYQYNTELDPPEWMLAAEAEAAATHWVSIDVPALQSGGVAQLPVIQIDLGGDKRHRLQHHEERHGLPNPDLTLTPTLTRTRTRTRTLALTRTLTLTLTLTRSSSTWRCSPTSPRCTRSTARRWGCTSARGSSRS